MNLTLDYLKSNRKWLVPNFNVWGNTDSFESALLLVEDGSDKRVVFSYGHIGGGDQPVCYSDLKDKNGNSLPSQIINPVVIIIPRNQAYCFIVGRPSNTGFKIACQPDSSSNFSQQGLVDLMIMEIDLP